MIASVRFMSICASVVAIVVCTAPSAEAWEKCKTFTVVDVSAANPTTGNEGLEITAGDDSCTVNFPAGITNNGDAAQEIIDDCNGSGNFTITRVGNEVTICHPTRTPKLRKVNIANKTTASVYDDTSLRSDNLIEFRGIAAGGGLVSVSNEWVQAQVVTSPGQTAEQIVDMLVQHLDQQLVDDPAFSFGAEYTAAHFGGPPLDSADLGIFRLGPLDLSATQFSSSDPGIEVYQEPEPPGYPTTCDGDGGPCGCGNPGGPGEGCENSTGNGALLSGAGLASLSADSFDLVVSQTPNQPGIFFQGTLTLPGGLPFGDGLRCCGGANLRLGTYLPAGQATSLLGGNRIDGPIVPVSQHPGNAVLQPGDTRCYQWWHRDPQGPCGSGFNLSNSIEAVWML